jgi:transcriptional regulator with XRE-family HTH domain
MAESLASQLLPKWRDSQGLKQGPAAKLFGVTQPMLSEYETGKKTPRTVQALKIAEITKGFVPVTAWGEPPEPEAAPASSPHPSSGNDSHRPTGSDR